jgi:hypothetical protein
LCFRAILVSPLCSFIYMQVLFEEKGTFINNKINLF